MHVPTLGSRLQPWPRRLAGSTGFRLSAVLVLAATMWQAALAPAAAQERPDLTFQTIVRMPWAAEALVADDAGNLYMGARATGAPCPIWRIPVTAPRPIEIGTIPQPCSPGGIVISGSDLLILDSGSLWLLPIGSTTSQPATQVATGMPGANAIAVDRWGNRFVSDGITGLGRVWRVTPQGEVSIAFQIQAMANDAITDADAGGVGRDHRSLPPGQIRLANRQAADTQGSQPIVANGLAFDANGDLLIADTARGAIWRARFDGEGNLVSPTGCDTTYPEPTLCTDALWVAHPLLEGADGIVFDANGNLWVAANERNALVVVRPEGRFADVVEVFRNPVNPDTALRNHGPLEFPTAVVFVDNQICVTHTDTGRRDNAPADGGELDPQGETRGKITCAAVR